MILMTFISLLIVEVIQQTIMSWKCSDIAEALDEGSLTALIILDLLATFDVIDLPILLKRKEISFGIKEKVLNSVKSYLIDRTQYSLVADETPPDEVFLVYHRDPF